MHAFFLAFDTSLSTAQLGAHRRKLARLLRRHRIQLQTLKVGKGLRLSVEAPRPDDRDLPEAERASRTKDEFIATVSHELRTPLNAVLGWSRLLRTGRLDTSATERAMEAIERSATTQAQIVDDLLDVARIVRGRLKLDVREADEWEAWNRERDSGKR